VARTVAGRYKWVFLGVGGGWFWMSATFAADGVAAAVCSRLQLLPLEPGGGLTDRPLPPGTLLGSILTAHRSPWLIFASGAPHQTVPCRSTGIMRPPARRSADCKRHVRDSGGLPSDHSASAGSSCLNHSDPHALFAPVRSRARSGNKVHPKN